MNTYLSGTSKWVVTIFDRKGRVCDRYMSDTWHVRLLIKYARAGLSIVARPEEA